VRKASRLALRIAFGASRWHRPRACHRVGGASFEVASVNGGDEPRSQVVARWLREPIYAGRLEARQPLRQAVAEELGVSRIPMREALRKLESEGLIVFGAARRRGRVPIGLI
jgi:regulatory GntR family protein